LTALPFERVGIVSREDYKIVAWNAMEPFAFFDPEFIKLAEQNGKPVRVTESSKQTITLNVW
jgi:hypothetical protein